MFFKNKKKTGALRLCTEIAKKKRTRSSLLFTFPFLEFTFYIFDFLLLPSTTDLTATTFIISVNPTNQRTVRVIWYDSLLYSPQAVSIWNSEFQSSDKIYTWWEEGGRRKEDWRTDGSCDRVPNKTNIPNKWQQLSLFPFWYFVFGWPA